jgi:hypothetical protein
VWRKVLSREWRGQAIHMTNIKAVLLLLIAVAVAVEHDATLAQSPSAIGDVVLQPVKVFADTTLGPAFGDLREAWSVSMTISDAPFTVSGLCDGIWAKTADRLGQNVNGMPNLTRHVL